MTALIVAAAAGVLVLLLALSMRPVRRALARVTWRFATGQHLDGIKRTNATAWRRATVAHPEWEKRGLREWHYRSHAGRAGIRWAVLAGTALVVFLAVTHPVALAVGGGLLVVTVAVVVVFLRRRRQVAETVDAHVRAPMWSVVQPVIDVAASDAPTKWLTVPDDLEDTAAQVTVRLPARWQGTPQQREALNHAVLTRLPGGSSGWQGTYSLSGAVHHVTYKRVPRPPKKVLFADVVELISAASESSPFFGFGPNEKAIHASWEEESPHLALSMASGAGKSSTARVPMMKNLHHGGVCVVLDFKRTSHRWAQGLPNVLIVKEIEDIHNTLILLAQRAYERQVAADENPEAPIGPRVLIVAEELNGTSSKLAGHWRKIKQKGDPAISPAVEALGDISFMGRRA